MIPYRLEAGATLPLARFAAENFNSVFQEWNAGNGATPDSKYLVFFGLSDIWALDRANYKTRPHSPTIAYILDRVMDFCGSDLQAGKCRLVFDMSAEGHPYHHQSFVDFNAWCIENNILSNRIALMSQNRALAESYENANREGSSGMRFFTYDQFIAGLAMFFEEADPVFQHHIGFEKTLRGKSEPDSEIKMFLCLNATPRPMRVSILASLASAGVLQDTLWSLLKEVAGKELFGMDEIESRMRTLGITSAIPFAKELLDGPPKLLDKIVVANANLLAYNIDLDSYDNTFMSIVTETEFGRNDNHRITEKLIKTLSMGHPAIVFGNPRSLALARDFGFQTFSPIIDEAYDDLIDPKERFDAAMKEIYALQTRLRDQNALERRQLVAIGEANRHHAFSGEFRRHYADVVEKPLILSLIDLAGS
jgi:hypothetical protein